MTKIIEFGRAESLRRKERAEEDLFSRSVDFYDRFLTGKIELFRLMVEETRTFLAGEGIRAEEFELVRPYFMDFLTLELDADLPREELYAELAFQNVRPDRILAASTFAIPDEKGNIRLAHGLYKLEDYRNGNRLWFAYSFAERRWEDTGEDLFDLEEMLAKNPWEEGPGKG